MLKKIHPFVIILSIVGIFFISQSFVPEVQNSSEKDSEKIKALEMKVDSLSRKVAQLEEKVNILEKKQYKVEIPKPFLRSPEGKLPPNWKEYEFNGRQYYMIPLDKQKMKMPLKK